MDDGQKSSSRPSLFRALGAGEPPVEIVLDDVAYKLREVIKHDSWAATALYSSDSGKVICKFNRTEPIFGIPMKWLGRWLASRERSMYLRLSDMENIPNGYRNVFAGGHEQLNAAAHQFVEGSPLRWHHRLDQNFYLDLRSTVEELHARRIAVVDLNKKENIIVGTDKRPYLIDFQISVRMPRFPIFTPVLKILQRADTYHLEKHFYNLRPDLLEGFHKKNFKLKRPFWIQLHRQIAIPFRQLRRRLLVALKVRKGDGKVHSEQFVESGLRKVTSHNDPLLSLYEMVTSQQYYQHSGLKIESYIAQLFSDLLGRQCGKGDRALVDILCDGRSHGEVAMHFLRSPELFKSSNSLSDQWLRDREKEIRLQLSDIDSRSDVQIQRAA